MRPLENTAKQTFRISQKKILWRRKITSIHHASHSSRRTSCGGLKLHLVLL